MFRPLRTQYLGYWLIFLMLVLAGWLNLGTPLVTVLFSYFVLRRLTFTRYKWISAVVFVGIVLGFLYLFGYFAKEAVVALPRIAEDSIPRIVAYAREKGITLPFEDVEELKATELKPGETKADDSTPETTDEQRTPEASNEQVKRSEEKRAQARATARARENLKAQGVAWLKTQLRSIANFARLASKEFAFLLIGVVVAISLFFNSAMDLRKGSYALPNNLYSFACEEVRKRFRSFYESFARVMGAQLLISGINTTFTAIYLLITGLPYKALVVALTFVCGLVPIIGNLISNSVIVALSVVISPQMAIASLIFLIVLHKTEYLLNSKIIGERIKNPVWLTLLALLLGERLMGVPGMILAPVLLDFVRNEAATIEIPSYVPKGTEDEVPEHLEV